MRHHTFVLTAALAVLPVTGYANADKNGDIIETAIAAGSFKTLAAALQAGGLVQALRGEGPFTVFAPTDEAFAKLPKGTIATLLKPENKQRLVEILTYHVVPGRISAVAALQAGKAKTLQKSSLTFALSNGQLTVSGRKVIKNDINASNGVIHVIDEVLIPKAKKPSYAPLSPAQFLKFAVEKGIPLFNSGNHAACVSVYEVAIRATLDLDKSIVSPEIAQDMKNLMAKASGQDKAREKAWTLRKAIDLAWMDINRKGSSKRTARTRMNNPDKVDFTTAPDSEGKSLFTFDEKESPWFSVNDNVMGGISRDGFSRTDAGTGLFSGALSLDNNGGFSTIRSQARNLGLAGYDGVVLRVRGDGRTYRFSARKDDSRRGVRNWQTSFETKKGEWMDIRIPFDKLSLRIMGRWVRGAKGISPADIRGFSIGIADKDETPFRLEIASIRAIELKA